MTKKKVFLSFDFSHDRDLTGAIVAQAEDPDSPFEFTDLSLQEASPEEYWLQKARTQIEICDVFIVVLGQNTHDAQGVLAEVEIARSANTYRFRVRPQGKTYGRVTGAGPVVNWKQNKLKDMLARL